jgi:iron complex transport system ATP-binding protein
MRSGERPQDYEAADRALAEADLLERAEDLYTNLSGGEKQRVHLARVLAQIDEPSTKDNRFLFLDEPTNNLDLSHQKTINDIVLCLAARGVSVCVVLHDLNHAFRLADQVLILDRGRIALQGLPEEIAKSPECEKIFGVNLRRIEIPGETTPFLYLS